MSRDGYEALPFGGKGLSAVLFVIVVFPDHTHLLLLKLPLKTRRHKNKVLTVYPKIFLHLRYIVSKVTL